MDDAAVETADVSPELPSDAGDVTAESESPSVDAQAADANAGSTPSDGDDEPEEWSKLLKSRGISTLDKTAKQALAQTIYKNFNDNARFAKETETLKAQLAEYERKLAAQPAEPEPTPEPPPELSELDSYITALKADVDANAASESKYVSDVFSLERQIAQQEVRLEIADELDRPRQEAKLEQLKGQLQLTRRQLAALPADRKRLEVEIKRAERDRKVAERSIEEAERARQQAGEQQKAFQETFPKTVGGLINSTFDELKFVAEPELRSGSAEFIQDGLAIDLFRLNEAGIDTVDVKQLVRARVEKFGKLYGLIERAQLHQASKAKAPTPKPVTVARTAPAAPTAPKLSIEEQLRLEREARIKAASNVRI